MLRLHTRAFFKDYLSIFHTTSYSSTPLARAIHWGLQCKPLQGGAAGGGVAGRGGGGLNFTGESDSTVWGLKKGETKQQKQVWFHSHLQQRMRHLQSRIDTLQDAEGASPLRKGSARLEANVGVDASAAAAPRGGGGGGGFL
jgi:hypothetical protein